MLFHNSRYSKPFAHPVLVAVGPAKKTILQFYVKVDGRMIPIKTNCTSIEAFDRLYQSYVVFNCEFDWEVKTFFDFLQYFVYDKKEGANLTTRQKEIWKLISVYLIFPLIFFSFVFLKLVLSLSFLLKWSNFINVLFVPCKLLN